MCIRDRCYNRDGYNDGVESYDHQLCPDAASGIRRRTVCPVSYTHLDVYKRQILNVLEKINPENREPFFYRQASRVVETDKVSNIDEINKYIETIEQIDKVTRIWIDFLLQQAISKAKNENTETIFKNILPIFCNNDLDAIQILINDVEFFEENNKMCIRDRNTILRKAVSTWYCKRIVLFT